MATTHAEFTITPPYPTDRRSPSRWLFSHAIRKWPLWIAVIGGSLLGAILSAYSPILIGQAFNAILETPPNTSVLPRIALLLAVIQVVRGVVQFGRAFGAEFLAQKMERDVRNEVYTSLLGKSMTFH